jgi:hypothetical protein
MSQRDQDLVSEVVRLAVVCGFMLGLIVGVFFVGIVVSLHR